MSEQPVVPWPGTGIFEGMPAATYHAIDAVSATALKTVAVSPAHEKLRRDTPVEPTPAMILGTAVHTLALEPEKIDTILVSGQCVGMTKSGPNAGAACRNPGTKLVCGRWYCGVHGRGMTTDDGMGPVLTAEQFESAKTMARAIRNNRMACKLLTSKTAKMEVSFFWRESITLRIDDVAMTFDVPCKCRADFYDPALAWGPTIADIKTCQCSSRPDFEGDIAERKYHIQNSWYLDGVSKALGGVAHEHFVYIAIESPAPNLCHCYKADHELITRGRDDYQEALKVLLYCQHTGRWPGYHDEEILPVGPRGFKFHQVDRELKRDDRM